MPVPADLQAVSRKSKTRSTKLDTIKPFDLLQSVSLKRQINFNLSSDLTSLSFNAVTLQHRWANIKRLYKISAPA